MKSKNGWIRHACQAKVKVSKSSPPPHTVVDTWIRGPGAAYPLTPRVGIKDRRTESSLLSLGLHRPSVPHVYVACLPVLCLSCLPVWTTRSPFLSSLQLTSLCSSLTLRQPAYSSSVYSRLEVVINTASSPPHSSNQNSPHSLLNSVCKPCVFTYSEIGRFPVCCVMQVPVRN